MSNPKMMPTPFAENGSKQDIPVERLNTDPVQSADYDSGFPIVTMTPIAAGGKAPRGVDFNGVLNDITSNLSHMQKGGRYLFDAAFAAAVGGYPRGSILFNNNLDTEYISLVDNNTVDFNTAVGPTLANAWALYGGKNLYLRLTGGSATGMVTAPKFRANKGSPVGSNGSDELVGYAFNGPDGDTGMFAEGGNASSGSRLVFRQDGIERLALDPGLGLTGDAQHMTGTVLRGATSKSVTADLPAGSLRPELQLNFVAKERAQAFAITSARVDTSGTPAGSNDFHMQIQIIDTVTNVVVGSSIGLQSISSDVSETGLGAAAQVVSHHALGGLTPNRTYAVVVGVGKTHPVGPVVMRDLVLNISF